MGCEPGCPSSTDPSVAKKQHTHTHTHTTHTHTHTHTHVDHCNLGSRFPRCPTLTVAYVASLSRPPSSSSPLCPEHSQHAVEYAFSHFLSLLLVSAFMQTELQSAGWGRSPRREASASCVGVNPPALGVSFASAPRRRRTTLPGEVSN